MKTTNPWRDAHEKGMHIILMTGFDCINQERISAVKLAYNVMLNHKPKPPKKKTGKGKR